MKVLKRLIKSENGGVMVLVSVLLAFVLLGMAALAVDVGYMYSIRSKMVIAADASAIAGAKELVKQRQLAELNPSIDVYARVRDEAKRISKLNGIDPDSKDGLYSMNVEFPKDKPNAVKVTVWGNNMDLFFAKAMWSQDADIGATATAEAVTYGGGSGMIPLVIEEETAVPNASQIIHLGAGQGTQGMYMALNFNVINGQNQGHNNGANYYEQCMSMVPGFQGQLKENDTVEVLEGVQANKTINPIQARINVCASCDKEDCINNECGHDPCPRVVIVPVTDELKKGTVTITGFAAFYLESVNKEKDPDTNEHKAVIHGYFIEMLPPGSVGTGASKGTYIARLIE